jgi:uncharacterized protein (DUF1015 family)
MVDFRPLRGIRYQAGVAGTMNQLVCPPYDVISKEHEQALLARSPNNMVRLELSEASGNPDPERYEGTARTYDNWLASGVLHQDLQPGYYLLRQRFPVGPGMQERYSLIGALRLEELGKGVRPHEHTGAEAKADRLALMESCAANFSPIMALYQDEDHIVQAVLNRSMVDAPVAKFDGDDGQQYALWRITDERAVATVHATLASQPVYIADGHHRYETALTYLERRQQETQGVEPAAEFVMMSLIAFDDPGLLVLPYHRVVRDLPPHLFTEIRDRIAQLFVTQPVSVDVRNAHALEVLVAQEGANQPAMVLVGPSGEEPYLLTIGNPQLVQRYTPQGPAAAISEVEAWLLEEVLLRPILGDDLGGHLSHVHQAQEALDLVRSDQAQLAFLLKGLPTDLFRRLVDTGVRLPRKSTYFHPKLPSGMVINSLQGPM